VSEGPRQTQFPQNNISDQQTNDIGQAPPAPKDPDHGGQTPYAYGEEPPLLEELGVDP